MRSEYVETARAFDTIAPHYDAVYGRKGNAVMTWMRRESLALLEATFPPGTRLLEIGCGTGDEAMALARAGRHVLATDISPGMAAETVARARTAGLADRVTALSLPAGGLAALRPSAPFDGAYASFGALNCEPHLGHVALALKRLLRPGGAFVCSVMARWCPFEIAWFLLHGRPAAALRRLRRGWQPAPVAGGGSTEVSVSTRYLSIGDLARAFGAAFHVEAAMALPLLLPPPYLDDLYRGRRRLFERLESWERLLRDRWPFWFCGDHIALVLRLAASDQRTAPAPDRPRLSRG